MMTTSPTDRFLTTRQLCERYGGVSQMWVWRRLHDDPTFPRPRYIARRRFWSLADLIDWDAQRGQQAVAA